MIGLQELRDSLGIEDDDHDDDAVIMQMEAGAVALVETNTGFTYPEDGQVIEYIRGNGTADLFLQINATTDPTEVLERPAIGDTGTAITAAQSDGWVRRGQRLVRKGTGVWTLGYEYQVTHAGGYVVGTEPADVREAVKQIVAVWYGGRGGGDLKSETLGKYSYTTSDAAGSSEITAILDRLAHRPLWFA